jgi:hypothetical protein
MEWSFVSTRRKNCLRHRDMADLMRKESLTVRRLITAETEINRASSSPDGAPNRTHRGYVTVETRKRLKTESRWEIKLT